MERPPIHEARRPQPTYSRPQRTFTPKTSTTTKKEATTEEKKVFKEMLENLVGTRGAHILDDKLNILGKVPISELQTTIKSLSSGVYAIVFDGVIDGDLVRTAERANIRFLIGMDSRIKANETSIQILTVNDL